MLSHVPADSVGDLWWAWGGNPGVWAPLATAALAYRNGRRRARSGSAARTGAEWASAGLFALALASLALALVSPLDALSTSLASAHMVQHLLLIVVAPPLLALSGAGAAMARGLPRVLRRRLVPWRRAYRTRIGRHPWRATAVAAGAHAAVVWFWHARGPYDAAVGDPALHALEHGSLLATALLAWAAVIPGPRRLAGELGVGLLALFALSAQSSVLVALLTFAPAPWYDAYTETATRCGLSPLADQQLAGVIMWVPVGASTCSPRCTS